MLLFGRFFGDRRDFSFPTFKVTNALADKINHLSIDGTILVFCNISKFMMEFRIDFKPQMLIVLIPHGITSKTRYTYFKMIGGIYVDSILKSSILKVGG